MADCFQASTPAMYRTPKLTDKIVGVVPFVWVTTPGKPHSDPTGHPVKNITKAGFKTPFEGPGAAGFTAQCLHWGPGNG